MNELVFFFKKRAERMGEKNKIIGFNRIQSIKILALPHTHTRTDTHTGSVYTITKRRVLARTGEEEKKFIKIHY